jgi:hypothetical protein
MLALQESTDGCLLGRPEVFDSFNRVVSRFKNRRGSDRDRPSLLSPFSPLPSLLALRTQDDRMFVSTE